MATHLNLDVEWEGSESVKTYQVTGTRHAGNLLRKFAQKGNFRSARLHDRYDNAAMTIRFDQDDILGSDRLGKFSALFDRSNRDYNLGELE